MTDAPRHAANGVDELVGREPELDALVATVSAARAGRGGTLVIRGAAGLGKTALLTAVAGIAGDTGMRVLRARGDPLEQEFPWGVVTHLLAQNPGAGVAAGSETERTLDPAPSDGASLMAALHRLYWRAVEMTQDAPVMLVIDDAHWSDALSMRWLAYMANRVDQEPILLVVASRPGGIGTTVDVWSAILSTATVVDLAPLNAPDSTRLLTRALGERPEAGFADICHRQSGGNPFLLSELAASLKASGIAPTDEQVQQVDAAGEVIAPTVSVRLRRLGDDAHTVGNALALLGPEATVARLGALSGRSPEQVTGGLRRLVDDGLVVEDPELAFAHPLLRTAAYEDLSVMDRSSWHLRAAHILDAAGCGPGVWTSHLLRAMPGGDPWVVERLREAASGAGARAAPDVAVVCLRRALEEPPTPDALPGVILELARVEVATDPAAAADRFREGLGLVVGTARDGEARIGLAAALSFAGRFREAADVLEEGLSRMPQAMTAERDELLAALLETFRWDLDCRPRSLPYLHAVKVRSRAGEELPARLRANLAAELVTEGRDREWTIAEATAAIGALKTVGLVGAMWLPMIGSALAGAGLVDHSLELNRRNIELIRRRGRTTALPIALAGNAQLHIWRGDIASALVDAEEAVDGAEDPISIVYAVIFLAEALRLRDDRDAAWELLERHHFTGELPGVWPYPQLRAERGWLRWERDGDPRAGLRDLTEFARWAEQAGLRCPAMVPWRSRAAILTYAVGDPNHAVELAEAELADARLWGEPRTVGTALRGVAAVRNDGSQIDVLREAVAVLTPSGARLDLAEALIDLGSALRRRGQRREAREPLRQALHLADVGGAFAARRRAHQELVVAGGRPRRPAVHGRDALTPSELRIAQLAGQGHSNPEIANLLFITRRTVETHLTQAYRKLDIRARDELQDALRARG
ncbi:MAG TPA: AAA family ATPase [Solirubrobacteraceae bacterium]|jgi:DNA-binding CsgD family transcriptional regulator|nr:AAA family ATPase [Solirubrobacteraceae bacterium]